MLVYGVQTKFRVGIVYGGIVPVAVLAASPFALNRNALLGSPYRVAGPFTEYPAAVAAPPPDIGPVRFSLDTCGKSSRVIHDRMCKLPPPTGGTWRPCAAAETSRGKGGKKLPPAVLSGLGGKIKRVTLGGGEITLYVNYERVKCGSNAYE